MAQGSSTNGTPRPASETVNTAQTADITPPIINALDIKIPYGTSLLPNEIASVSDDKDESPTLEVTSFQKINKNEPGSSAGSTESAPVNEPESAKTENSITELLFSEPGLYSIVLTATDQSGNRSQKEITVTVIDKTPPVLNGLQENYTIAEKDTEKPNYLDGITATDEIDGDLTESIIIDDSKVKYKTVGTYNVTYTVSDKSENKATAAVPVIISDTTPPVITLSKTSISKTVIDSKPNYSYYVSKVEDANDGNVKSSLTVDDSSIDYKVPGTYNAVLHAQDKSGNTAESSMQVIITAGWITQSRKQYYYSPDDGHKHLGWSQINGEWYYFDPNDGHMLTGLQTVDGKQYLLDQKDGHQLEGWQLISDKWYYFSTDDGHMYHSWSNVDGKQYYFDPDDGHMVTGLLYDDGYTYLLDEKNGNQVTGWQTIDGKVYYFSPDDGHMYHSWSNIDGEEYYFHNDQGYLLKGLCTINGDKYLLDSNDGHQKTGWQTTNGNQYYFSTNDGHMYHDWSNIDGSEYYFDPDDGHMYTGTHYIDGDKYEFGTSGVAHKVETQQRSTSSVSRSTSDYSYIGNRNSGIFHKSSCSSVRKMKDSNKVGFDSRSDAIDSGYRPCKNCNP